MASPSLFVDDGGKVIRNPTFKLWARDPVTGLRAPAGWQLYERRGSGDQTSVEPADVFGVEAVDLHVAQDGKPDPGQWSHTGLVQEIPFPTDAFSVTILSEAPFTTQPGGWPLTAFGFEVSDGKNDLIWILFQPTGNGDREYDLPTGHHIKVFDVPFGQWATRSIDLPAMYRALNRGPVDRVTLKLFIAASSAQSADIGGYIAGLADVPATTR